ncbi:MAG: DUF721 domain-containing protein [Bryobacteraceae bacterium]|nr:DUF721 domain-containing protein [Bryobacteraceae bacterium]
MERVARLLTKLKAKNLPLGQMVCAAWPEAVGKTVARRTRAVDLVGGRLIVEVEDMLWQKNLHGMRGQILRNLRPFVDQAVTEIEYRIAIPRRPPGQAMDRTEDPAGERPFGEAAGIADPLLRKLYLASGRRRN